MSLKVKKYGFLAAVSIVVANMVGTGVFTSLGYQLVDIKSESAIILLWILGGIIALMGSFCYAELSAAFPRSGGEYHFLKNSFGDFIGFLSGWTSSLLGFAAPMAAAAFAFSSYFIQVFPVPFNSLLLSAGILVAVTAVQLMKMQIGEGFQVVLTIGKVLLMFVFIVWGLGGFSSTSCAVIDSNQFFSINELFTPAFWTSLIFVSYSYSGWNATAYIIDDIEQPKRVVPRSILLGTIIVMLLYVGINYVFMKVAPLDALRGKEEVAHISGSYLFGASGAQWVSIIIAFFLISSISSMAIIGPRVIRRMADDYQQFAFLAVNNKNGIPARAVWVQLGVSLSLLFTSSFAFIITSIGFLLTLFSTLTVIGLMILRNKYPDAERTTKVPLYPLLPILFVGFNLFTIVFLIQQQPREVLISLLFLAIGALVYYFFHLKKVSEH